MNILPSRFRRPEPGAHDDIDSDSQPEPTYRIKPPRFQPISKKLIKPKRHIERELFEIIQLDRQANPQDKLVEIVDVDAPKPTSSFHQQQLVRINKITERIIEKLVCAICLNELGEGKASLRCGHSFCLACIQGSARYSSRCPYCRQQFTQILSEGTRYPVESVQRHEEQNYEDQPCYVCGRDDRHDQLLICDLCEYACCHVSCDPRLHSRVPAGHWYCTDCTNLLNRQTRSRQESRSRLMRNLMTIYRLSRRNN